MNQDAYIGEHSWLAITYYTQSARTEGVIRGLKG